MAHLIAEYVVIPRRLSYREPTHTKNVSCSEYFRPSQTSWKHKKNRLVAGQCSRELLQETEVIGGELRNGKGELQHLVSDYGWKVRRLFENESEMREVAHIQAEAFHVPVSFFNDLLFLFFQAEVLSGLLYKLRNSSPDRYACLVAESNDEQQGGLVGVVDATILRDGDVLQHLDGVEEYIYISGIAVSERFRRQKVATVLLKACDMLTTVWGVEYLVLRAYEDDIGACKLYTKAGYRVVSGDPRWATSWIGRKRRILLVKKSNLGDWL